MFGAPAHSLLGWTVQQEWESGRSLAEVQKKVYQTLHTDGMGAGHGLHGLGLLYGCLLYTSFHGAAAGSLPPSTA